MHGCQDKNLDYIEVDRGIVVSLFSIIGYPPESLGVSNCSLRPRNLKELCSEGPGFYSHWRQHFVTGIFRFRIVKPLMLIMALLPICAFVRNSTGCIGNL